MDKNTRNMLIVFGIVVVALVALAFIGNLLSQILPLTIALVVGIVLGRLSVNVNLADVARKAISQQRAQRARSQAAKPKAAAKPAAQPAAQAEPDSAQQLEARRKRIADAEPAPAEAKPELNDFEIKSEEEILAEAREREAEIRQKQASADAVKAALEERRRRLLSGQEGGES